MIGMSDIYRKTEKPLSTQVQNDMIIAENMSKGDCAMELTYTSGLENEFWNMLYQLDECDDYSIAIDFLNSRENFQPFGARLAAFIANKLDLPSTDSETVRNAIKEKCSENGVDISEIGSYNTLRSWFESDKRPKKSVTSRWSMFALAFALNLSMVETTDLFHKIYLDRAVNYRDEKEAIFYFCLINNKTWADAKRLIAEADDLEKDYSDITQQTNAIAESINTFQTEQDLLECIRRNGHNFEKNSVKAKEMFNRYLIDAKRFAKEEINSPYYREIYSRKWTENLSNNALYEIITEKSITGAKGTKTVFNNATLPKEIKNRFPEAATFGKSDMTSEEYRKAIILLFPYGFWYQIQSLDADYDFDDYIDQINNVLVACNFPKLYFGNPFDWMFLLCAQDERPLDVFRELISEVLPNN